MRSEKQDSSAAGSEPAADAVTALLAAHREGDPDALDCLAAYIQPYVARLARGALRRVPRTPTLSAGDVMNEAQRRVLLGELPADLRDRATLMRALARATRNIVVERQRRRRALKRGGGRGQVPLEEVAVPQGLEAIDQLVLAEALDALRGESPLGARCHEVVLLRCYAGLELGAIAELLGVSRRTVDHDWQYARAFLARRLPEEDVHGA